MNKEIELIRDSIKLIKQLPESDLKHEAVLALNLLLSETIVHSDWVVKMMNRVIIDEEFTL
jgi:hypothetical protein